jgi:hypothetical protein
MALQDYTIQDIKRYMRDRLEGGDNEALFEFTFQNNCRDELEKLGINPDTGLGILFSFAAIAGGWKTEVGRRLVGSGSNALGLDDDFDNVAEADLTPVQEAGYGGHSHRHANGAHPEEALNSLSERSLAGESLNSMEATFSRLEKRSDPFDSGLHLFENVSTFGGLAAFDFLEVAVRVNQQESLVPDRLAARHVDRNGPQESIQKTLSNEAESDVSVCSPEGEELLDELLVYAKSELGLSHTAAVFDVESCLCTYHGELENEGPDWRGCCN